MGCRDEIKRMIVKRSTVAGTVPTVPASDDHTDGSWIATDIYKGEFFFNQADGIVYTRSDAGIMIVSPRIGKHYKALITDNAQVIDDTGPGLTIGETYAIIERNSGCDFTNVGAVTNSLGEIFVATGTTPTSWGSFGTSVLMYNLNDYTIVVLEQFGMSITWTLDSVDGTSQFASLKGTIAAGTLDPDKVAAMISEIKSSQDIAIRVNDSTSFILEFPTANKGNYFLNRNFIDIKVYT